MVKQRCSRCGNEAKRCTCGRNPETMTPRQVDALIAEKVMGREICTCNHEILRVKHYEEQEQRAYREVSTVRFDYFPYNSHRECNTCRRLFIEAVNYSTNIAAAWEVVEKLRGLYLAGPHHRPDSLKPLWRASFTGPDHETFSRAESAAEAICLAALKAVGHALPDDSEDK
jgi:hypothetical protein